MQAAAVVIVQFAAIFNAVVYFAGAGQILVKGIEEIEMVVLTKIDPRKIVVNKRHIAEL